MRLAFFGGVYNNSPALYAAIRDARCRGAESMYCLGDLGAFGPHPDQVFPLLTEHDVSCVQGNYDNSIGRDMNDCQCGYTDPRDNHFAKISYEYTYANTSVRNRRWLRDLPQEMSLEVDGLRLLLCHGSPRRTNEFLWESTTSTNFLDKLARDYNADVILGTHTGLHWQRALPEGRRFVNVGVLGRPANDGHTRVWYTLLCTGNDALRESATGASESADAAPLRVDFIPLHYDHRTLARQMREENLPEEFVTTILTGWWTTCLEVLPGRERRWGRY